MSSSLPSDFVDCAINGKLSRFQSMLKANISYLNATDNEGRTVLMLVCLHPKSRVLKELLKYPALLINMKDTQQRTALHFAVYSQNTEACEALLLSKHNCDVDATVQGLSGLMISALRGYVDIVKLFVDKGKANISAVTDDQYGFSALHLAAQNGHSEVVQFLLKRDADQSLLNRPSRDGYTALMIAAQQGHRLIVFLLIAANAEVNHKSEDGFTALLVATQRNKLDVVQVLLQIGRADTNVHMSKTPAVFLAAQQGNLHILRTLVRYGAEIEATNFQNFTSLHIAAHCGHEDIVQYLLSEAGANSNATNHVGVTALYLAAQSGHLNLVKLLQRVTETRLQEQIFCIAVKQRHRHLVAHFLGEGTPDLEKTLGDNAQTPLYIAATQGDLSIVSMLIGARAKVDAASVSGFTSLLSASYHGFLDVVKELVTAGSADVAAVSHEGCTSLYLAAQQGHVSIVKFLCESAQGAKQISIVSNQGYSPVVIATLNGHTEVVKFFTSYDLELTHTISCDLLYLAAQNGHLATVKFLISECQARVEVPYTANGDLALNIAAQHGHLELVRYFVKSCQADVNASNQEGFGPLIKAVANGHRKVSQFLCRKGAYLRAVDEDDNVDLIDTDTSIKSPLRLARLQGMLSDVSIQEHNNDLATPNPRESLAVWLNKPCDNETCRLRGRKLCGRCKQRRYCSQECQATDWRVRHSVDCSTSK